MALLSGTQDFPGHMQEFTCIYIYISIYIYTCCIMLLDYTGFKITPRLVHFVAPLRLSRMRSRPHAFSPVLAHVIHGSAGSRPWLGAGLAVTRSRTVQPSRRPGPSDGGPSVELVVAKRTPTKRRFLQVFLSREL